MYMYKQDMTLNNLQMLIYQPNRIKQKQNKTKAKTKNNQKVSIII